MHIDSYIIARCWSNILIEECDSQVQNLHGFFGTTNPTHYDKATRTYYVDPYYLSTAEDSLTNFALTNAGNKVDIEIVKFIELPISLKEQEQNRLTNQ